MSGPLTTSCYASRRSPAVRTCSPKPIPQADSTRPSAPRPCSAQTIRRPRVDGHAPAPRPESRRGVADDVGHRTPTRHRRPMDPPQRRPPDRHTRPSRAGRVAVLPLRPRRRGARPAQSRRSRRGHVPTLQRILADGFDAITGRPVVLSHTDAGPGNTIWDGERAIPIDFEFASLAPADLESRTSPEASPTSPRTRSTSSHRWSTTNWPRRAARCGSVRTLCCATPGRSPSGSCMLRRAATSISGDPSATSALTPTEQAGYHTSSGNTVCPWRPSHDVQHASAPCARPGTRPGSAATVQESPASVASADS